MMHAHTPAFSRTAHGPSSSPDRSRQAWLLVPVALAVFLCSALLYYHIRFGGVGAASNPAQQLVVGLYRLVGFVPALLVGILLLVWSTIWFLGGQVERPVVRVSRLLAVGSLFAILLSLQPAGAAANPAGGMLGGWFAVRLTSALGYAGATLLVTLAALASVCLATDFFFSRWVDRRGASSGTAVEDEVGVEDQAVAELAAAVATVDGPAEAESVAPDASEERLVGEDLAGSEADESASSDGGEDEAESTGWRSRRYGRRYGRRYSQSEPSAPEGLHEEAPDPQIEEIDAAAGALDVDVAPLSEDVDLGGSGVGLAADDLAAAAHPDRSGQGASDEVPADEEEERENLRHGVRVLTPNARAVVRADLQPIDRSTPGVLDVNTAARKVLEGSDQTSGEREPAAVEAEAKEGKLVDGELVDVPVADRSAEDEASDAPQSVADGSVRDDADTSQSPVVEEAVDRSEPSSILQPAEELGDTPEVPFVDLTESAAVEDAVDEEEEQPTPWQPRRRWTRDELQAGLGSEEEDVVEEDNAADSVAYSLAEASEDLVDDEASAGQSAELIVGEDEEESEEEDDAEHEELSEEEDDAEYEEESEEEDDAEYEEESEEEDDAEYEEESEEEDDAEYEEESEEEDDAEYEEESEEEDDAEYEEESEEEDDAEYEEESEEEDDAEYEEESEEEDDAEYEEESEEEDDAEYEEEAGAAEPSAVEDSLVTPTADSDPAPSVGESSLPPGSEPIGDHLPPRLFDLPEDLIEDAAELVQSERRASVTLLQRRLRIDHEEARHVLEALRRRRIVGGSLGDTHGPVL